KPQPPSGTEAGARGEPVHCISHLTSAAASCAPNWVATSSGSSVSWLTNTNRQRGWAGESPPPSPGGGGGRARGWGGGVPPAAAAGGGGGGAEERGKREPRRSGPGATQQVRAVTHQCLCS